MSGLASSATELRQIDLLIDGRWRPGSSGQRRPVINPATEQPIASLACASPADLDAAVASAQQGFLAWKNVPAIERGRLLRLTATGLRSRAREIGRLITEENGKTWAEGELEVNFAADYFEWYAEEARRLYGRVIPAKEPNVRQYVVREPIGPVLALSPWNWPLVTASRKVAPALAAGCSVILKPAEETPSAVAAMASELLAAGLPPGVLNMVSGDPAMISAYLIPNPVIRKVSFTGSTPVGRLLSVQAGQHLKPISLELGGHAPVIICHDADIAKAIELIVPMKFRTSGQVCSNPSRYYVHDDVYDDFVGLLVAAAAKVTVGDGFDPNSVMGPLSNERRLTASRELVEDAVDRGAKVLIGGERVGDIGYFFAPTVIENVSNDARLMNEEPFGPLMPISRFSSYEDVIERANSLSLGLASYVFTRSLSLARSLGNDLQAGLVGINTLAVSTAEAPFGGVRDSGNGQEGGIEGIDAYVNDKLIVEA